LEKKIKTRLLCLFVGSVQVFSGHCDFVVNALGPKYKTENLTLDNLESLIEDYNVNEWHKKYLKEKIIQLRIDSDFDLFELPCCESDHFVHMLISCADTWMGFRSFGNYKVFKLKSIEEELLFGDNLRPGTLARVWLLNFDGVDLKRYGVSRFCNNLKLCKNAKSVSFKDMKLNQLEKEEWDMLGETLQSLEKVFRIKFYENNLQNVNEGGFQGLIDSLVCSMSKNVELLCDSSNSKEFEFFNKILNSSYKKFGLLPEELGWKHSLSSTFKKFTNRINLIPEAPKNKNI
jgi:hypothetical protein